MNIGDLQQSGFRPYLLFKTGNQTFFPRSVNLMVLSSLDKPFQVTHKLINMTCILQKLNILHPYLGLKVFCSLLIHPLRSHIDSKTNRLTNKLLQKFHLQEKTLVCRIDHCQKYQIFLFFHFHREKRSIRKDRPRNTVEVF